MTEVARDLYLLVAVLGLAPAVSLAGMPLLSASAFAAVGGVGALQLERAGLPIGGAVLVAVILGGLAGVATGALVARAEAPFVALSTWALAWLAYTALLVFPGLSGGEQGLTRPTPDRVQAPFGVTLTLTPAVHVVASALLCALVLGAVARLRAGPAGLDAAAGRDDRELARSLGTPVGPRRVALTGVAGAASAAAGAGIAVLLGVAAPADVSPLLSLQLFAAVIVGARSPLLALAVIAVLPRAADAFGATGTGIVTAALLAGCVALRPYLRPRARARAGEPLDPPPLAPCDGALSARDVHVALGGREILGGLDLELRPGEIHALVGPNGSGKTTALRVLAGDLAPGRGTLRGGPVVRTVQRAAGFASLTPLRQALLAAQAGDPVRFAALWHLLGAPPESDHEARAWGALALVGLTARADALELTDGEQRLLAVARAAVTGAPVLALDEPAVGMTAEERARLVAALRRLAAAGRAILIVEHDLRLVAALADVVTVIDDGRVIARGTPAEVVRAEPVQRAYLGAPA